MRVGVRLFGDFRQYLHETGGRANLDVDEGVSVRALLDRVGVPEVEVGLVSINGSLAPFETVLRDGDQIDVFSPIGGGQ